MPGPVFSWRGVCRTFLQIAAYLKSTNAHFAQGTQRTPLAGGFPEYLGFRFRVRVGGRVEMYQPSTECRSTVGLLPPFTETGRVGDRYAHDHFGK